MNGIRLTRFGAALAGPSALMFVVLSGACNKQSAPVESGPPAAPVEADDARLAQFRPALPAEFPSPTNPITDEKIALGRLLYFDARLSKNQDVSCNSCHDLATFGVDGKKVSAGHKKQNGTRNSPTVYNAAGHFVQFWDGRAKDVEEQASGPMTNPVEMAMASGTQVEAVLRSIPRYVELFGKAFPNDKEPVNIANATLAIGAFERRLSTPSRWDKFLGGDKAALTAEEKAGLGAYLAAGCTTCHVGTHLGATMYQKLGLIKPWPNQKDMGRFMVSGKDADMMSFKVPTLRNIEKTGPYFHDGSVASLEQSIQLMARHQVGKELSDATAGSIATFLRSLTGTLPTDYIKPPELPPSTPATPKPDPA